MAKDGRQRWRFATPAALRPPRIGYSFTPDQSDVDSNPLSRYDHSSDTSPFNSDISIGTLFEPVSVNMASAQPEPDDDEIELIDTEDDPWIRHLNMLWDIRFEQRESPTDDALLQVNMGDEANPKPIYISDTLSPSEKDDLIALIREYIDVFARHYEDMPGLDPKVAMHRLNIKADAKPVKQSQRRFRPEIMDAIELEVRKLVDSGSIREEQHPDWVVNIVPVIKKNGSIRICIDFRNLNDACSKDEFPLSVTDIMVDNTTGYERMSFMDGFSEYNQIKMDPDNERHTAFRTPLGVFCYTVMPFGLKNADATYQRAMDKIFSKLTRKIVECYVDDIAVKSRRKDDHLRDLREVFDLMRTHQLKMNPAKSFLGVSSGKFLGFVVTAKGIISIPRRSAPLEIWN